MDIVTFDIQYLNPKMSVNRYTPPALSNKLPTHTALYLKACGPTALSLDEKTQILPRRKLVIPPQMVPITLAARYHTPKISLRRMVVKKSAAEDRSEDACAFMNVNI